jgi:hypothetical protein
MLACYSCVIFGDFSCVPPVLSRGFLFAGFNFSH